MWVAHHPFRCPVYQLWAFKALQWIINCSGALELMQICHSQISQVAVWFRYPEATGICYNPLNLTPPNKSFQPLLLKELYNICWWHMKMRKSKWLKLKSVHVKSNTTQVTSTLLLCTCTTRLPVNFGLLYKLQRLMTEINIIYTVLGGLSCLIITKSITASNIWLATCTILIISLDSFNDNYV